MRFEIREETSLSGTLTSVRIPEALLDTSALYTLQADLPDFIVPFRYRIVDGYVECVYEVEGYNKLQYYFNSKTTEEYISFWEKLLQPLLDCGDWFLEPLSFVLDTRYLYIDKAGKKIAYIYVPAKEHTVELEELRSMVVELTHRNPVMDQSVENQVLKAIMQGFQPKSFLQLLHGLKKVDSTVKSAAVKAPEREYIHEVEEKAPVPVQQLEERQPIAKSRDDLPVIDGNDIEIHFAEEKPAKKQKAEKKPRKEKKEKEKGWGLFGKKEAKAENKELRFGTAEKLPEDIFSDRERAQRMPVPGGASAPVSAAPALYGATSSAGGETELEEGMGSPYLQLVGDMSLPREIPVELQPGQIFSIGRFDVEFGRRQSSFEFEKNTKAVSRHHAAIERREDGSYTIVDLNSKAGTYVQGQRLTPNAPAVLQNGCRVSFGTSGADYVWRAY